MNQQNAFLLGSTKYGDNDAILHCFGQQTGYCTYFFKGIFKSKRKAFLQPLLEVSIVCSKGKGDLLRATKIELVKQQDLTTGIKSNSIVFFISELLLNLIRNEASNQIIYNQITEFGNQLENECFYAHLTFLIQLLQSNGLSPLLNDKVFLNPESGSFEEVQINSFFTAEISSLWKEILTADNPYSIIINNKYRKELLESIMVYYQYHVPHFRIPKSLEIIRQIFEE